MVIQLHYHTGVILPFHNTGEITWFLHEVKDPEFRGGLYGDGRNFLGGNFLKGVNTDSSPSDVAVREVQEEFWCKFEAPESLDQLLGARDPDDHTDLVDFPYDPSLLSKVQHVGSMLTEGLVYAGDYIATHSGPVVPKGDVIHGLTVFLRQLDETEFLLIKNALDDTNGRITTDNVRWNSSVVFDSVERMNAGDNIYSWGYGRFTNELLASGVLPSSVPQVKKVLPYSTFSKLIIPDSVQRDSIGSPILASLEEQGVVQYRTI
jgi:hypothetical protein